MNRISIIGAILLTAIPVAMADAITPEQALMRLNDNGKIKSRAIDPVAPRLVHTAMTSNDEAAVYVFTNNDEEGYLVLSADDMAYPLLGYADEGSFDYDNIPPAMLWWLNEYSRQIEYARTNGSKSAMAEALAQYRTEAARLNRESVVPLIKTQWDQGEPYHNNCPLYGETRTYTGCVATSMAQVMNYWKYPERGKGNISYLCSNLQKKLSLNLALKKFDWNNMLETYRPGYYNDTQANAVAYLMKACGYAVSMEYGTDSSGALAMNVRKALIKYFGYDGNMLYTLRDYYSSTDWNEMMYKNIKNVGPVIYGGGSNLGGGHSFICDGYDNETGLFHFNWGWTGMSNGYFSLDALNPDALGSGGGNGGGYNFTQDAVFGIQPPTGEEVIEQLPQLTMQGSLVSEIIDGYLTFDLDMQNGAMWVNYNPETLYVEMAAAFTPQGSTPNGVKYFNVSKRRYEIAPGYGFAPHKITESGIDTGLNPLISTETLINELADGVYKVTFVTRDYRNEDAPWQKILCPHGYYEYVTVTKAGRTITVKDMPAPSLDLLRGEFTTKLMPYNVVKVSVDISNPSDIELTTGLAPVLVANGQMLFIGESVFVTVEPHTTVTKKWNTSMSALVQMPSPTQPTTYQLLFLDERSFLFYDFYGTATMYPQEYPKISLKSPPHVKNATRTEETATETTYYISDPSNIEVVNRVVISSDDFSYPLVSCLCLPEGDQLAIQSVAGSTVFYGNSRLPKTINTTICYPQFNPNERYLLYTALVAGGYMALPSDKTIYIAMDNAGVDNITADNALSLNYDRNSHELKAVAATGVVSLSAYSVSGGLIGLTNGERNSTVTLSLDGAPQGIIVARAVDAFGNTKTIKIAR